eukprot:1546682-Amphidinium_carterae.1
MAGLPNTAAVQTLMPGKCRCASAGPDTDAELRKLSEIDRSIAHTPRFRCAHRDVMARRKAQAVSMRRLFQESWHAVSCGRRKRLLRSLTR